MTRIVPAEILRHRGAALVVRAVEKFDGTTLHCSADGDGPWRWPTLLEGAAQAAGLVAGLRPGGLSPRAMIAEYRDVAVHAATHTGPVRFTARVERRILRFSRCGVEVRDPAGTLLLDATVTLAPER